MHLQRNHPFSEDEACGRLRALTDYWANKYGVKTVWQGKRAQIDGKVKAIKFSGTLSVAPGQIVADIKAGFLAEKAGGRKYVEEKLRDYLDPGQTLEALQARAS